MRRVCLVLLALAACDDAAVDAIAPMVDAGPDAAPPDAAIEDLRRGLVTHEFGMRTMEPFEEITECVSWTLNNEKALYVERIEFNTGGAFHHSNWFVVPEDTYPGPDGYFDCQDRGFDELESAVAGTVIFAQSTQARFEEQRLGDGVVIKIPPRHRVVAGVHMLNLSAGSVATHLRFTMEAVHPEEVRTVVSPFRLNYLDLQIPSLRASHFTARCDLAGPYEMVSGTPLDMKLYYALPHYHELGNYFNLTIRGGPRDGESLVRIEQFDAEPHGVAFDPPVDLTGATGLEMTCGYDNPRPVEVNYGIGDQEMCVMLGFAESRILMDASVNQETAMEREELGISHFTGPCSVLPVPKHAAQTMPDADELAAPLYVPESDVAPDEVAGPPECEDTPAEAVASAAATVENLRTHIFRPSCTFSACHGPSRPAGGLNLAGEDVRDVLLDHTPVSAPDRLLVVPGDPDASLLYQRISRCDPEGEAHMPLNSETLLDPGLVALVRDWIADGAQ